MFARKKGIATAVAGIAARRLLLSGIGSAETISVAEFVAIARTLGQMKAA